MARTHQTLVVLLLLSTFAARAQTPAAPTRGELLYGNHCGECHSEKKHWRSQRAATDWASLSALVRRWQGELQLGWSDADIDEVTRYLNERFYRYPGQPKTSAGLRTPLPPRP
jgi:mono/diheme cytochrome c family protein